MIEEDFFVLLDLLRDMPEVLLHKRSLCQLAAFIDGWCFAHKNKSINQRMTDFNDWIQVRFGKKYLVYNYPEVIAESYGDEKGFDVFWECYDEFIEDIIEKQKGVEPNVQKPVLES
jgi:hypothetical protein